MSRARPLRFRLYPDERSRLYIRVHIWPSHKAMVHYMKKTFRGRYSRRTLGFCTQVWTYYVKKGRPRRMLPVVAEVNLFRAKCTMEVVTHELFHATLAWGRRIKFPWAEIERDPVNALEEELTYAHSTLCQMFMVRAEDAGIYERVAR